MDARRSCLPFFNARSVRRGLDLRSWGLSHEQLDTCFMVESRHRAQVASTVIARANPMDTNRGLSQVSLLADLTSCGFCEFR